MALPTSFAPPQFSMRNELVTVVFMGTTPKSILRGETEIIGIVNNVPPSEVEGVLTRPANAEATRNILTLVAFTGGSLLKVATGANLLIRTLRRRENRASTSERCYVAATRPGPGCEGTARDEHDNRKTRRQWSADRSSGAVRRGHRRKKPRCPDCERCQETGG